MKILPYILLALLIPTAATADTPQKVRHESMLFGSVIDAQCEEVPTRLESAFGAWALKFAVNSFVGFASAFLDKATEATTVVRVANAPGHFYAWDPNRSAWIPNNTCVRFWFGNRSNSKTLPEESRFGVVAAQQPEWKRMLQRWSELGFTEQPYLYGEVRFAFNETDNTMVLQPVVLFARRPPEGRGIFREVSRIAVAIDLKSLSQDKVFATHLIELPDVSQGAVLVQGATATSGLASAWASIPPPPAERAKARERSGSPFSALVTFTTTSDGTLFGKTVAATLKAQNDELISSITPQSRQERDAKQEKAISDAFDAIAEVLDAEKSLAEATDLDKPKAQNALSKAKYLANAKLAAAGLPPKYSTSSP